MDKPLMSRSAKSHIRKIVLQSAKSVKNAKTSKLPKSANWLH